MIIVEGPDGVGKTTLCRQIAEQLQLNYVKIPRTKNDIELNGFKFYLQHAETIARNSVIDRFHIGECVYPRLYQDDPRKPLKLWQQHCIERLLMIRGGLLIHVNANTDFITHNLEQRREGFIYSEVLKEQNLFAEYCFMSILPKINFITGYTNLNLFLKWLKLKHDQLQKDVTPFENYKSVGSVVDHPVMIVGDTPNKNNPSKYAFNLWKEGSSYLHEALEIAGCKQNYYITNAIKPGFDHQENIRILMQENFNLQPIVRIVLGLNAHNLLTDCGLTHTTIEHPAHHQRFNHDVYAYAALLNEVIL